MFCPKVKVCGMTRHEDVRMCARLGADFTGFIFHEPSPRNITEDFAAEADPGSAAKVGVFVRQDADEIIRIMDRCKLRFAQMHGGHSVEECKKVGPDRVIKALWPEKYDSPEELQADIDLFSPVCAYLLFDAGKSGGGHGKPIALTKFEHVEIKKDWFLAGGLCPENVTQAVTVCPTVLDLNSGVESAPGIKDETKLRAVLDSLAGN